jgi:hypothetical protein
LRHYSSDLPVTFVYGPFATSKQSVIIRMNADRVGLRLIQRFEESDFFCKVYVEENTKLDHDEE